MVGIKKGHGSLTWIFQTLALALFGLLVVVPFYDFLNMWEDLDEYIEEKRRFKTVTSIITILATIPFWGPAAVSIGVASMIAEKLGMDWSTSDGRP